MTSHVKYAAFSQENHIRLTKQHYENRAYEANRGVFREKTHVCYIVQCRGGNELEFMYSMLCSRFMRDWVGLGATLQMSFRNSAERIMLAVKTVTCSHAAFESH